MNKAWWRAPLIGVLCALGTPALAQPALPAPEPATELPRVLPIWSNHSGRVEALLLVDEPGLAPRSTLDALLAPRLQGPGLRGRSQLGGGFGVNLDLRAQASPAMALLCEGNVGLAVALGRFADSCLLAQLDDRGEAMPLGRQAGVGASLDWRSADGGIDLSFGLSWLDTRSGGIDWIALSPLAGVPAAPIFGEHWQLEGHEFHLQGQSWLTPRSWLRVDGRHGHQRLATTGFGLPLEWDTTSLSLSGGYRAFSGTVTGRVIEINHPRQAWADVDVALSWRTPWDARVSVGARNLLGGPADRERWPLSNLPGLQDVEARTPYVRYHQDL